MGLYLRSSAMADGSDDSDDHYAPRSGDSDVHYASYSEDGSDHYVSHSDDDDDHFDDDDGLDGAHHHHVIHHHHHYHHLYCYPTPSSYGHSLAPIEQICYTSDEDEDDGHLQRQSVVNSVQSSPLQIISSTDDEEKKEQ